jgi:hypothetical protein
MTTRRRTRISTTEYFGPFRFRLSVPLGRGRVWGSAGVRTGRRGWASVSAPLGGKRRRSR